MLRHFWIAASTAILISAAFGATPSRAERLDDAEIGILVLAHGASPEWNKTIEKAVADVRGGYKKIVVFGMGDSTSIQTGIDALEKSGVKAIVVIPLFLSSHSEMYRNMEYVLGIREEPDVLFWILMSGGEENGHTEHGADILERAKFSVPNAVAGAINYHPLIEAILAARNGEALGNKKDASIFLLAHGPISAEDNFAWLRDLNIYAAGLSGKFPGIRFFVRTFRDDAPSFIKDRAIRQIKETMEREKEVGRAVIVVPYLLAPGGREEEIKKIAGDCGCTVYLKTLLPHENISRWISEQIKLSDSVKR